MSRYVDFNRPHSVVPTGDEQKGEWLVVPSENCPVSNYIGNGKDRAEAHTFYINEMQRRGWTLQTVHGHDSKNPDGSITQTSLFYFQKTSAAKVPGASESNHS